LPSGEHMSLRLRPDLADANRGTSSLGLLGGFELRAGAQPARLPLHMQKLLAFLALQGRPLHRAYVAGRLWIELNQEHAHACLRSTIWRMGRLPCRIVDVTSTHVALAPDVAVDARQLEASAERVLHDGGPPAAEDADCLIQAADLLPDWYDDWALQERERLRQLRLLALEAAGDGLIGSCRYAEAAMVALAGVASDPLRESAYRLLIRSYLGEGNVAEALRQFTLFRAQLHSDLSLEPSPQIQALIKDVS
jgi:DNA-binding SARP family transcriptional activator